MIDKKKIVAIILLVLIVSLIGCQRSSNKNLTENKDEELYPFNTKFAMVEGDNGWVHHFICEYDAENDKPLMYYYDAYNLKYKQLDDYVIEIVDENGIIEDIAYPAVPYLMLHNDYTVDYMNIDTFFNSNHPIEKLNEEDADILELEYIDENLVIDLFNTAIESDIMENGIYYNLPEADIVQETLMSGYLWQVGYFNVHGVIVNVNIELLYEDGSYLKDIVKDGQGDNREKAIANMLANIEVDIVKKQSFIIDENQYDGVESNIYNRLKRLLQRIEGEAISNG
ncbi:MAG: hypothetical protein IJV71_04425 [Lachnospiraceae bacterium]|nr:hypothetical protein [Lachnospiraceae bacterium]